MVLMTPKEYEKSLRKLNLVVYMFGKKINNVVDDPIINPSMKAVAMTYELAQKKEESHKAYYRLLNHWQTQRRGSGYLPKYVIDEWLENWSENEIKIAMDNAEGMWQDLKNQFE